MELWDNEAIDLLGPAFNEINADGTGAFQFIAVVGNLDCHFNEPGADSAVEFTWDLRTERHRFPSWPKPLFRPIGSR
jgi:hypothetical protein